jgi:hypothetical protein
MEKKPEPDLDDRFSLLGEDPEEVARKFLESDEEESEEAKQSWVDA